MALSASDIVPGQVMIPIDVWHRLLFSQNSDYFLQQPHIIASVSYTHLDVYKRQAARHWGITELA